MFVDFFRDFIFYLEILAAIVASITFKKYRDTPSRYFLFLLWATIVVETIGLIPFYNYYYPDNFVITFLKKVMGENLVKSNIWIYNLNIFIVFSIYFLFFMSLMKLRKHKKIIKMLIATFILIGTLDIVLNASSLNKEYLSVTLMTGALVYFVFSSLYFIEIIKDDGILVFYKKLEFWIIIGALVFYLTTIPIFIFSIKLKYTHSYYRIILNMANIVLYGSFITGFIVNAYQQKKVT